MCRLPTAAASMLGCQLELRPSITLVLRNSEACTGLETQPISCLLVSVLTRVRQELGFSWGPLRRVLVPHHNHSTPELMKYSIRKEGRKHFGQFPRAHDGVFSVLVLFSGTPGPCQYHKPISLQAEATSLQGASSQLRKPLQWTGLVHSYSLHVHRKRPGQSQVPERITMFSACTYAVEWKENKLIKEKRFELCFWGGG